MSSVVSRNWRESARSLPRKLLRWLPGVVVTLLAVYVLARLINWGEFLSALVRIPAGLIVLAIVIYLVSMVMRGLAWQYLLQRQVDVPRVVLTLNEGYFFNNILPFRMGELARAILMGRHSQRGTFYVLSTIVVERSYDLVIAAGLLLATIPLALNLEWARPVATLLLALVAAGLLALYLAARHRERVEGLVDRLAGRWGWVKRWVSPQVHSILSGFSMLTRFEYFAGSFGLMALSWFLAIVRDWLLIRVFVPDAPLWWAALGISAANLAGAVPSVMAALGTYELGAVTALSLVGMNQAYILAYTLVVHVIHLISSSLIGGYALSREGQTISRLYAEIRRAK